jgi:hypothetical protein
LEKTKVLDKSGECSKAIIRENKKNRGTIICFETNKSFEQTSHQSNDSQHWESNLGTRSVATAARYHEANVSDQEREKLQLESRTRLQLLVEQMKTEQKLPMEATIDSTCILYPHENDRIRSKRLSSVSKAKPVTNKMFVDDNSLIADSVVDSDDRDYMSVPRERLDLDFCSNSQINNKYNDFFQMNDTSSDLDLGEKTLVDDESLLVQENQNSSFDQCYHSCIRPQRIPALALEVQSPSIQGNLTDIHSHDSFSFEQQQQLPPQTQHHQTNSHTTASVSDKVLPAEKITCIGPISRFQQWSTMFICAIEGSLGSDEESDDYLPDIASFISDKDEHTQQDSILAASYTTSLDEWTEYDGASTSGQNWISRYEHTIIQSSSTYDDSKASSHTGEFVNSETDSSTGFGSDTGESRSTERDSQIVDKNSMVSTTNGKTFDKHQVAITPSRSIDSSLAPSKIKTSLARSSQREEIKASLGMLTDSRIIAPSTEKIATRQINVSKSYSELETLLKQSIATGSKPTNMNTTSHHTTDTASVWLEHIAEINRATRPMTGRKQIKRYAI